MAMVALLQTTVKIETNKMTLSEEDPILIKNRNCLKGYGAKRLMKEFPTKGWKKTTPNL
jgi:hypothetical protein